MKAFVTSIGEPTTWLCCDQLRRYGFDVVILKDDRSLAEKLREIYTQADDDFLRVDADVVPNRRIRELVDDPLPVWWVQARIFDWLQQDLATGGIQFIRKEALPHLREHVGRFLGAERPETQLYRLEAFHEPRRCVTSPVVAGLHGFRQGDLARVRAVKERRGQTNYDWPLVERLEAL